MMKPGVYRALNRLLSTIERSLPIYLSYAAPWTRTGDEKVVAALGHIVDDQKQMAARIADLILETGPINIGEFAIEFLDMHDLSLDYLVSRMVEYQKKAVADMAKCVEDLQSDRPAAALGEEALGAARGHLETLEELAAQMSPGSWMR